MKVTFLALFVIAVVYIINFISRVDRLRLGSNLHFDFDNGLGCRCGISSCIIKILPVIIFGSIGHSSVVTSRLGSGRTIACFA